MGKRIKRTIKKFGKLIREKDVRERLRSSRNLKRERIKKLQTKLTQEWNRFWESKPDKNQIINFIQSIESPSLQRKALKMSLKNEDFDFEDYYSLVELVMKIKGRVLKRAFWKKCFSLARPENWVETIKNEDNETIREMFLEELLRRIKRGVIPRKQGGEILVQIFEETPEPPEEKIRKRVWHLLKILNPTEKDLLKLAGLECMRSMIGISGEVRNLLDKIKQEKNTADQKNRLFQQIINEINQNVKRLEQIKKGQE